MSVCAEHPQNMPTRNLVLPSRSVRRHFKGKVREHSYYVNVAVYRWLLDIVPEGMTPSFVLQLFGLFGLLLNGGLLRSPGITRPCDASFGTDIGEASGFVVACTLDSVQHQMCKEWQTEAFIKAREPAFRALILMGSGVLGAIDGLITAPWKAYASEWSTAQAHTRDMIERMAWCTGQSAYGLGDRPMPRDVDEVVNEVLLVLSSLHNRGWLRAELEAGDIQCALKEVVCRPRVARILQNLRADVGGV